MNEEVKNAIYEEEIIPTNQYVPYVEVIQPTEEKIVKEDKYDHIVYAYQTDIDGNIIGAYQGKNPPEDYTHIFDYPLEAGASIKYGEVTISSAYIQQTKAALYAQINAEYQEKLAKLQSTIASLSLQGLDTTTAKEAYIKLKQQYKNALLEVANITIKE